jgi:predicted  nucleic acid-binding Zn-ribbon protein
MTAPPRTLADCSLPALRCSGCGHELPASAKVELYGRWIVAECPKCGRCTPFQLEAA